LTFINIAKHAFAIIGPGRMLLLSANNEKNKNSWIHILEKHIAELAADECRRFIYSKDEIVVGNHTTLYD
jgi:hypothetical protein